MIVRHLNETIFEVPGFILNITTHICWFEKNILFIIVLDIRILLTVLVFCYILNTINLLINHVNNLPGVLND